MLGSRRRPRLGLRGGVRTAAACLLALGLVVVLALVWRHRGAQEPAAAAASPAPPRDAAAAAVAAGRSQPAAAVPAVSPGAGAGRVALARTALLRFQDESGAAVPHARFALRQGGALLAEGQASVGGEAEVAAAEGAAWILVTAPGHAPHAAMLGLEPGPHDIVLPAGAVVAGRVLVDGAPPAEPVTLTLTSDVPLLPPNPEFDEAASFGEEDEEEPAGWLELATGPGGLFRLAGLPMVWKGTLAVYREDLASEAELGWDWMYWSLQLSEPRDDILVRLRSVPVLRGRLLAADGKPLQGTLEVGVVRESGSLDYGETVGSDGRFTVALRARKPPMTMLSLCFQPEGMPAYSREWAAAELPADYDLGDIFYPAFRRIAIRAVEPHGLPVAGATASADAGVTWSEATGADGTGALWGPTTDFVLLARADGRLEGEAQVPPGVEGPVTVVLPPANQLLLHVIEPDGTPARDVTVTIQARRPLFAGDPSTRAALTRVRSGGGVGYMSSPGSEEITMEPDSEGRLAITGLQEGSSLLVKVLSRADRVVLHEETLLPMPPAGLVERQIVVAVEGATRWQINGRLVGPDGEPVGQAVIHPGKPGGQSGRVSIAVSDEDGRFSMTCPDAEPLDLVVQADEYAPLRCQAFPGPPNAPPIELRLERVRTVTVLLVGPDGQPTDWEESLSVLAELADGSAAHAAETSTGVFQFSGLPPGVVRIRVARRGSSPWPHDVLKSYGPYDHDSADPELRIEVGACGSLEVQVRGAKLPEKTRAVVLLAGKEQLFLEFPSGFAESRAAVLAGIPPGDYQATLYGEDPETGSTLQVLAGPIPVQILANRRALLVF